MNDDNRTEQDEEVMEGEPQHCLASPNSSDGYADDDNDKIPRPDHDDDGGEKVPLPADSFGSTPDEDYVRPGFARGRLNRAMHS